jgi:hypothetical protein
MPKDVLKSQSLFIENFLKKEYDDMILQEKSTHIPL